MRILKGQEILPDNNTLVEHDISDGTTVNIVIEPDKEIKIVVKNDQLSYYFPCVVTSSVPLQEVKDKLIRETNMVIPEKEFDLVIYGNKMKDTTLTLHYYDVTDGSKLSLIAV